MCQDRSHCIQMAQHSTCTTISMAFRLEAPNTCHSTTLSPILNPARPASQLHRSTTNLGQSLISFFTHQHQRGIPPLTHLERPVTTHSPKASHNNAITIPILDIRPTDDTPLSTTGPSDPTYHISPHPTPAPSPCQPPTLSPSPTPPFYPPAPCRR